MSTWAGCYLPLRNWILQMIPANALVFPEASLTITHAKELEQAVVGNRR